MLPTLPDNEKKQTLFSRDFILLFCMAMCNNSYMAVFYCFEQWLEGLQVSPNWRGILLSALFAMVLLWRPLASIVLLSRSKLPALLVTICLSSCIMLAYPFIHGPDSIWLILGLLHPQGPERPGLRHLLPDHPAALFHHPGRGRADPAPAGR